MHSRLMYGRPPAEIRLRRFTRGPDLVALPRAHIGGHAQERMAAYDPAPVDGGTACLEGEIQVGCIDEQGIHLEVVRPISVARTQ